MFSIYHYMLREKVETFTPLECYKVAFIHIKKTFTLVSWSDLRSVAGTPSPRQDRATNGNGCSGHQEVTYASLNVFVFQYFHPSHVTELINRLGAPGEISAGVRNAGQVLFFG